ncbi:hypothetical protein LX36DRAFT_754401 [Colletotrichum falcatum]|nr:hypothetical protein LX36DRAFT_754401 [Colletotrichum falcatum]
MKTSSALAAVLGPPLLASAAICNNNCGRAVAGTARQNPPFAARQSQCAALVSPPIVAPMPTITGSPVGVRNVHGPRQVRPPVLNGTVPAYASACADITAYWSACQCFSGTSATAVTTATATVNATASLSSSPAQSTSFSSAGTSSQPSSTEPSSFYTSLFTQNSTIQTSSMQNSTIQTSTMQNSTTQTSTAESSSSTASSTTCTPTPVLPSPTVVLATGDDVVATIQLPFAIGIFGAFDKTVYASSNGLLSLFTPTTAYQNKPLPDLTIPAVSVLTFFDDLQLFPNTNQIVAYQIFGSGEGNRTVTFEWNTAGYQFPDQFYHFTATFQESQPGVVVYRYYSTADEGSSATVGAQNVPAGEPQRFVQYSFNTIGAVPDKTFVRLDTTGNGTYATGTFYAPGC